MCPLLELVRSVCRSGSPHKDGLVLLLLLRELSGGVVVMVGVMMVLVEVGVGTPPESDSDLRVSLARRNFFSLAFSRPALQNSSNLELMSSSDLLAAPADVWLLGLSSMFSSSTSCNI